MLLAVLGLVLLASFFIVVGISDLAAASVQRREMLMGIDATDPTNIERPLQRWDRWFRSTKIGGRIHEQLVLAGEDDKPAILVTLIAIAGGGLVAYVMWVGLAPVFSLLGVGAIVLGLRIYISRAKTRRREAFLAQMPELPRVLSNGTNAGLAIATAVAMASEELAEPAGSEMARVARQLKFGASLQESLQEVEQRLPSREVAVLVSTLLVSARCGVSLLGALRDIADILESRKEVRREVRTTLAQATATGYLVIVMGFAILFLLNIIQPGTVEEMTTTTLGQVALVVGGTFFVGGFLIIRRMTKFEG